MIQFVLLAMQAAGMVIDWATTQEQIRMGRMGAKMEQAGIAMNIEMTRAQAEDASLQSMKQLRQTLGSQAAVQAARGTKSGVGSALSVTNESMKAFSDDERTRRMNLLAKEAELKAGSVMSKLHQEQSESQLGAALRQRFFDKLPLASALSGGSGATAKAPAYAGGGTVPASNYGMTSV